MMSGGTPLHDALAALRVRLPRKVPPGVQRGEPRVTMVGLCNRTGIPRRSLQLWLESELKPRDAKETPEPSVPAMVLHLLRLELGRMTPLASLSDSTVRAINEQHRTQDREKARQKQTALEIDAT